MMNLFSNYILDQIAYKIRNNVVFGIMVDVYTVSRHKFEVHVEFI